LPSEKVEEKVIIIRRSALREPLSLIGD